MTVYLVTKDPITKKYLKLPFEVEGAGVPKIHLIKKQQNKMFTEKAITCSQCKKQFIWTVGEQKFIHKLYEDGKIEGVVEPKRCPECRQKKKERYDSYNN